MTTVELPVISRDSLDSTPLTDLQNFQIIPLVIGRKNHSANNKAEILEITGIYLYIAAHQYVTFKFILSNGQKFTQWAQFIDELPEAFISKHSKKNDIHNLLFFAQFRSILKTTEHFQTHELPMSIVQASHFRQKYKIHIVGFNTEPLMPKISNSDYASIINDWLKILSVKKPADSHQNKFSINDDFLSHFFLATAVTPTSLSTSSTPIEKPQNNDNNLEKPQKDDNNLEKPQKDDNLEKPRKDDNLEKPQKDDNLEKPRKDDNLEKKTSKR